MLLLCDSQVYVANIVPGGSADRSGVIRINDVIVKVCFSRPRLTSQPSLKHWKIQILSMLLKLRCICDLFLFPQLCFASHMVPRRWMMRMYKASRCRLSVI
jgi:hypothetical protein